MVSIGRDLWIPSSPALCSVQGHLPLVSLLRVPSTLALNVSKFRVSTTTLCILFQYFTILHWCIFHFLSEWKLSGVLCQGWQAGDCACCAHSLPGNHDWAPRCCGQKRWWKLGTLKLKVPMTFMPSTGSAWVIVAIWGVGTVLCGRGGALLGAAWALFQFPHQIKKCLSVFLPSLLSVQVKTLLPLGAEGWELHGF